MPSDLISEKEGGEYHNLLQFLGKADLIIRSDADDDEDPDDADWRA